MSTANTQDTLAVATRTKRFTGVCSFVNIKGQVCGKRCQLEDRCSVHKGKESYETNCIIEGCTNKTRSAYGLCSKHHAVKTDKKRPELPDDLKELTKKFSEMGYIVSARKRAEPKQVPVTAGSAADTSAGSAADIDAYVKDIMEQAKVL